MSLQDRLARALDRLATGVGVQRVRTDDRVRAISNGDTINDRDERLEEAVVKMERAADELWEILDLD